MDVGNSMASRISWQVSRKSSDVAVDTFPTCLESSYAFLPHLHHHIRLVHRFLLAPPLSIDGDRRFIGWSLAVETGNEAVTWCPPPHPLYSCPYIGEQSLFYYDTLRTWGHGRARSIGHASCSTIGPKDLPIDLLIWQAFIAKFLPVFMLLQKQGISNQTQ